MIALLNEINEGLQNSYAQPFTIFFANGFKEK